MAKKVTGIGGLIFKSKDPEKTKQWYSKHLGFNTDEYGTSFQWQDENGNKAHSVWSPLGEDHEHFEEGEKDYILNLRVDDLDQMIADMRQEGVQLIGDVQEYDYGRFAYVIDPDGMKLELWEPNDEAYDEMNDVKTP